MKIYTGTGDSGKTSLFSGERVAKSSARIDSYGDIDELNAIIGWVVASLADLPQSGRDLPLQSDLVRIQSDLFQLSAHLATQPGSPALKQLSPITDEHSLWLEKQIDSMDNELVRLNSFIIPGGHPAAAAAHVARTVCRRAERRVVQLSSLEADIPDCYEEMLVYLNRLSDYFFVFARYCNHLAGVEDKLWRGGTVEDKRNG